MGYAASGTIRGNVERDYHIGAAPQGLIALRLILGDKAALDLTAREYFLSRKAGPSDTSGHENITRADVAFTVRIQRQHAIAVKYLWNRRDASFPRPRRQNADQGNVWHFLHAPRP